jgi:hypothetical protein
VNEPGRLLLDRTDEPLKAAHGTARPNNTSTPNPHHPKVSAKAGTGELS